MTVFEHVCKYIYTHACIRIHIYILKCWEHPVHIWKLARNSSARSAASCLRPSTQPEPRAASGRHAMRAWLGALLLGLAALLLGLATLLGLLGWAPHPACSLLQAPWGFRVCPGALEPAVRVLAVVERHAMDAEHVGLQVPLLRGTVWAVSALEGPVTCTKDKRLVSFSLFTVNVLVKHTTAESSPAEGSRCVTSARIRNLCCLWFSGFKKLHF